MNELEEAVRALFQAYAENMRDLGPCQDCAIADTPEWKRVAELLEPPSK